MENPQATELVIFHFFRRWLWNRTALTKVALNVGTTTGT
jgi:hypothetical protein